LAMDSPQETQKRVRHRWHRGGGHPVQGMTSDFGCTDSVGPKIGHGAPQPGWNLAESVGDPDEHPTGVHNSKIVLCPRFDPVPGLLEVEL
jgi:hypothetical protein